MRVIFSPTEVLKTPVRQALVSFTLFLLFCVLSIYLFDSLGVRQGMARRGADMNWSFATYHSAEPEILGAWAKKYGTVAVKEANNLPVSSEGFGKESGYEILLQFLALLGLPMNYCAAAKIQVFGFLFGSFLFSSVWGLARNKFFPASYIIFALLLLFRHHNEPLIYGMVGVWMLVTFWPLLTLTGLTLIWRFCVPLTRLGAAVLVAIGFVSGSLEIIRESEAFLILFSCLIFLLFMNLICKDQSWKIKIVTIMLLVMPYMAAGPIVKQAIVSHRAWKTGLEPKQYNSGMYHGYWYVLLFSLGRYENPYGYYTSDYFVIDTANAILAKKKINTTYASREYQKICRQYYLQQIGLHPGYFLKYLERGFLDYLMFIPYSLFLDVPSRVPIGAHVPVIRHDIQYDSQDYVWHDRKLSDGSVPMDKTCLKNLKPSYFYLSQADWIFFAMTLLCFLLVPFFFSRHRKPYVFFLVGAYTAFLFYSMLRIIIPMHGWTATLLYFSIAAINFSLLCEILFEAIPTNYRFKVALRKVLLFVIVGLIFFRIFSGPFIDARGDSIVSVDLSGSQPQLLLEGYHSYNIVFFNGEYYGFHQGFLPNYDDPNLKRRAGVLVAQSLAEIKRIIADILKEQVMKK